MMGSYSAVFFRFKNVTFLNLFQLHVLQADFLLLKQWVCIRLCVVLAVLAKARVSL